MQRAFPLGSSLGAELLQFLKLLERISIAERLTLIPPCTATTNQFSMAK